MLFKTSRKLSHSLRTTVIESVETIQQQIVQSVLCKQNNFFTNSVQFSNLMIYIWWLKFQFVEESSVAWHVPCECMESYLTNMVCLNTYTVALMISEWIRATPLTAWEPTMHIWAMLTLFCPLSSMRDMRRKRSISPG